jgi:hypothetical protein
MRIICIFEQNKSASNRLFCNSINESGVNVTKLFMFVTGAAANKLERLSTASFAI